MKAIQIVKPNDLRGSISHKFHFLDAQKAFDFNDTHDPSTRKITLTFD